MSSFPEMPSHLRDTMPEGFWDWWQAFRSYLLSNMFTKADIALITPGRGVILTNKAGTIVKRVFLNDGGTDISVESL